MGVLDSVLQYKAQREAQSRADIQAIPQGIEAFINAKNVAHTSLLNDLNTKITAARYGYNVDTNKGTLSKDPSLMPSTMGYMLDPSTGTLQPMMAPGGQSPAMIPHGTKITTKPQNQDVTKIQLTGDPSLSGDAYLQDIKSKNPAYYNDLQMALNGTLDTTKQGGRSGMKAAQIQADAAQATLDQNGQPTFDPSQAAMRAGVYKDFTSGKVAAPVRSSNLLIQHMGTLSDAMKGLDPGQFPSVNAFNNFLKTQAGQGAITAVKTAMEPVSSEAATLFKGQGNSSQVADSAIQRFEGTLAKG